MTLPSVYIPERAVRPIKFWKLRICMLLRATIKLVIKRYLIGMFTPCASVEVQTTRRKSFFSKCILHSKAQSVGQVRVVRDNTQMAKKSYMDAAYHSKQTSTVPVGSFLRHYCFFLISASSYPRFFNSIILLIIVCTVLSSISKIAVPPFLHSLFA